MKSKSSLFKLVFPLVLCASITSFSVFKHLSSPAHAASSESKTFQAVAVEMNGTKFWFPSTFIVKKGDTVRINAISKIGGKNNVHGFAIDAFKVEALVDDKEKAIEFVADKAGIFPIRCHLHPAHIGGQLLVVD